MAQKASSDDRRPEPPRSLEEALARLEPLAGGRAQLVVTSGSADLRLAVERNAIEVELDGGTLPRGASGDKGVVRAVLDTLFWEIPAHDVTPLVGSAAPDPSRPRLRVERPDVVREVVKAIAHKKNVSLVNVMFMKMLGAPGFLARMARVFKEHSVDIDMIATSEVSVSLTVNDDKRLEACQRDLAKFADVTVSRGDRAIVCVVGHGLSKTKGVAGRVFTALSQADVNVDLISQGASKINIGFVVSNDAVVPAVRALHATFFGA